MIKIDILCRKLKFVCGRKNDGAHQPFWQKIDSEIFSPTFWLINTRFWKIWRQYQQSWLSHNSNLTTAGVSFSMKLTKFNQNFNRKVQILCSTFFDFNQSFYEFSSKFCIHIIWFTFSLPFLRNYTLNFTLNFQK